MQGNRMGQGGVQITGVLEGTGVAREWGVGGEGGAPIEGKGRCVGKGPTHVDGVMDGTDWRAHGRGRVGTNPWMERCLRWGGPQLVVGEVA